MPKRAQKLPGVLAPLPVTVTTRSINGSSSIMARLMATTVPTFCIKTPISDERPPDGTSLPVKILVSCLAPPDGYLVGMTRMKIRFSSGTALKACFNDSMASGLLSSIPINTSSGERR